MLDRDARMSARRLIVRRASSRWRRLLPYLVLAAVAVGIAYVNIGEWYDHQRFPQVGQSVSIGGRALNILCSGTGSPAVILESGYGLPGYSWLRVQPAIARATRTCWYDRAGNGWSDAATGPRYSDSVAHDLHALLGAARIPPPYVLVGHSLGAFHVRVFNALYPREVAGLVLVDPSNEDVGAKIPDMPRARPPQLPSAVVHAVDETVRQIGLWRWFTRDAGPPPAGISANDWAIISSLKRQRKATRTASQEAPERQSAELARAAAGLSSTPLTVLTRGKPFSLPDSARARRLLVAWTELGDELARRSRCGEHLVVPGAGHMIQWDAPTAVTTAVVKLVDSVRQGGCR